MDSKLYKGSLEPIILRLLHEHQEMYGYQITQLIKQRSDDEIQIKEGSLYPLLHKMEANGIIESSIRKVGNRSRKYYEITQKGRRESANVFEEMTKYMSIMNQLFNPKLT